MIFLLILKEDKLCRSSGRESQGFLQAPESATLAYASRTKAEWTAGRLSM